MSDELTPALQLRFGDVAVTSVTEVKDVAFPARFMFPGAGENALREQAALLGPRHVRAETQELLLSFNCYLVRAGGQTILVDSCIGNGKDRPTRPKFHMLQTDFLARLAAAGARPEDVDVVLCTHLHADHVGWNTRLENGRWVPTFPNARYLFAEPEFHHWQAHHLDPAQKEKGSYGCYVDSVLPVIASGQAEFVRTDHAVADGLTLEHAPGHTPGNVVLHLESGSDHAVFLGDTAHHPVQMHHPEWSTGFCFDPQQAHRTRLGFFQRFAGTRTCLLPAHFQFPTAGRVQRDGPVFHYDFIETARSNP
ncbi:MAG: MBL fold metallo-hydrolase [Betaproteobacteria bacterium]|nr:MBL fold metallo-hydrolase [Betaproteobacteria bacterium]